MKDCTPWKGPILEQFVKNYSPWEGLRLKKFLEDCLHVGVGDGPGVMMKSQCEYGRFPLLVSKTRFI